MACEHALILWSPNGELACVEKTRGLMAPTAGIPHELVQRGLMGRDLALCPAEA